MIARRRDLRVATSIRVFVSFAAVAAVCLAGVSSAGISAANPGSPKTCWTPTAEQRAQAQAVGERARRAVVIVQTDGGVGTGWFATKELVVTNGHVVEGAHRVRLVLIDGRSFGATVVATSQTPDVALLRVADPPADVVPLELGKSASLTESQPLVAVGHPTDVGNWVVSLGTFTERRKSPDPNAPAGYVDLESTVPQHRGSSGAPILDLQGKVVGIVWGSLNETYFQGPTEATVKPVVAPKEIRTNLYATVEKTLAVPIEAAVEAMHLASPWSLGSATKGSSPNQPPPPQPPGSPPGPPQPPGSPPTPPQPPAPPKQPKPPKAKPGSPKPPKPPKPPQPPKPAAPSAGPLFPCVPEQGAGFDTATLTRGQALTDTVRAAVILLATPSRSGTGTGWLVSGDGLIVTNAHNLERAGSEGLVAWLVDGRSSRTHVLGISHELDIAFLRMDSPPSGLHALELGSTKDLQGGQPLVAVGNPGGVGGFWTATIGRFTTVDTEPSVPSAGRLVSTVPGLAGSSGSPILGLDGKVVGMVYGFDTSALTRDGLPVVSPATVQTYLQTTAPTVGVTAEEIAQLGRQLGVLP